MIWAWTLCLVLGAEATTPHPTDPVPPALQILLEEQPTLLPHHQGYLKELARLPELAASETAWWQATRRPGLGNLENQFEEAIGTSSEVQSPFDRFYDQIVQNPGLRDVVENLLRTELDKAKDDPAVAQAVQYLRAHPDEAMRFLEHPSRLRPLPEPLRAAYDTFVENPEWSAALRTSLGEVLEKPEAYQAILPWWEELDKLAQATGDSESLPTELYRHPRELWLWHLRNINLARNQEARPWIRYWNRLIHRDPLLAEQYGPFVNQLLREPEQLRQHLANLQDRQAQEAETWPPKMSPPTLPPLDMSHSVAGMQQTIGRPDIPSPGQPKRPSMTMPKRPTPPAFPAFPSPGKSNGTRKRALPAFPAFPEMSQPEIKKPAQNKSN